VAMNRQASQRDWFCSVDDYSAKRRLKNYPKETVTIFKAWRFQPLTWLHKKV
jgi:hypothetical protein